jgi:hypothetical protein
MGVFTTHLLPSEHSIGYPDVGISNYGGVVTIWGRYDQKVTGSPLGQHELIHVEKLAQKGVRGKL